MIAAFCSLSPQTGKSTCAEYFAEKTGSIIIEFSYPIEIMSRHLFGYVGPKSDPDQRKILQDVGLFFKTIDPHYWCWRVLFCAVCHPNPVHFKDLSFLSINDFKKSVTTRGISSYFGGEEPRLLVSGMRSGDEADFFKSLGGKIFLVTRNFEEDMKKGWHDHKVESQLKGYNKFDEIIKNDGTINELKSKVDALIG